MKHVQVTPDLRKLIETMRALQYGELQEVELMDGLLSEMAVTEKEFNLIDTVLLGLNYIHKIVVHSGEPMVMEVKFEMNGFKGLQRHKL